MARHIVGYEAQRNAIFMKLPRRKAGALQVRAGLGHEYFEFMSGFNCGANHAESRANARRGQGAGIALRHHPPALGHKVRAKMANSVIGLTALLMNFLRFSDERLANPCRAISREFLGQLFKSPLEPS